MYISLKAVIELLKLEITGQTCETSQITTWQKIASAGQYLGGNHRCELPHGTDISWGVKLNSCTYLRSYNFHEQLYSSHGVILRCVPSISCHVFIELTRSRVKFQNSESSDVVFEAQL